VIQGKKRLVQLRSSNELFLIYVRTFVDIGAMTHQAELGLARAPRLCGKWQNEVFIYEGSHQGRILRAKASPDDIAQARLALRIAVTRAMRRSTILTPKSDVCAFL